MKTAKYLVSLLSLLLFAGAVFAQNNLISAKDFMDLRKSSDDLVIIDANKPSNYSEVHVKGAINVYHNDMYKEGDIKGLLMDPADLAAFFGEKGISETTPVVVYDDGSQKYSSRVFWALKYLGAENVKILHKDMNEWRKVRVPLTAMAPKVTPVTFTPTVNEALMATTSYVGERTENAETVIVDCRTADEYNGVSKSEGHVPGAININYEDLLAENGAFLPVEEMTNILSEKGVTSDKEIILYCRTSVRACVTFVALTELLDFPNVKVYDGAYLEWSAQNPVVQ
jgi:thiosulfate/3-mercaptopyruvate sulfurtransferase